MSNIIITGANQGIGYYLAVSLLEKGHYVSIFDIETDNLKALKNQYKNKLLTFVCDMRDSDAVEKSVERTVETFKTIDIAIHNACLCTFDSVLDTEEKVYADVFDVNYFGALRLSKAVLPYMADLGGGKVIFTSSGVGVMGFTNISAYASSKGAIEALAKCLGIEHKKDNITFHIFHPPLTATNSSRPLSIPSEFMADPEKVGRGLAKRIDKKSFIICHSTPQKIQTLMCYLFPMMLGRFMSKMTQNYKTDEKRQR